MASVKVKFRASASEGQPGSLYYQIIQQRVVRQISTDYKLYPHEWDAGAETVVIGGERQHYLAAVKERADWDVSRLKAVIARLETGGRHYTADEVITTFRRRTQEASLCNYMHGAIAHLRQMGRERTAETYTSALRSFMTFTEGRDLPLDGVSSALMERYEAWLRSRGVRMNSSSFYLRILRAVYNRAVEDGLTPQRHPFAHVYTGVEKTAKRAVPLKTIKALKRLDLTEKPRLALARDLFLFSFYTRGMSFVDMAYLRREQLQRGLLTYRRRKTGQELSIRWERCMQQIVEKYSTGCLGDYLLPIIRRESDERRQYTNALHVVNQRLKRLSEQLRLPRPLTMYVARHSWASAARQRHVPLSVISEGMGHDSEATTQIYLASLETTAVDDANRMLLSLL